MAVLFLLAAIPGARAGERAAVPDKISNSGQKLIFPAERSLGTLYLRPVQDGARENLLFFEPRLNPESKPEPWEWRAWLPAQGTVAVPAGMEVLLDISRMLSREKLKEGINRLAGLEQLPPDALEGLFAGGIQWGRAARASWAKGRITYIALYAETLNAEEFRTILRLTGLHYFSIAHGTWVGEFPVAELKELKRLTGLRELNVFSDEEGITGAMMEIVRSLPGCRCDLRPYTYAADMVRDTLRGGIANLPERTLKFTADRSMGRVKVRDAAAGAADWQSEWREYAEARGEVKIPAGEHVALNIDDAGGQDLTPLEGFPPDAIQFLSISSKFMLDLDLKRLKGLTGLKALSLQGCDINGEGFKDLRGLSGLEELRLGNHKEPLSDASMADLGALTSLKWLALWGTGISDAGLERLKPLDELRFIGLSDTKITDKGLDVVKGFTKLESLQLEQTKISDAGLAQLAGLTKLNHMNIGFNGITDAGLERLKPLRNLENVWIDNNPITDRGIGALAGLPRLKEIYAMNTQVTDAGWEKFMGHPELYWVTASGMGDRGVAALADCPKLYYLQISEARITAASADSFKKMKSLKQVRVSGTPASALDPKILAALKTALPKSDVADPQRLMEEVSLTEDQQSRFDAIYCLKDGEVFKRVPPPFIPERLDYYRAHDASQAAAIPRGPDVIIFRWSGALERYGMMFGSPGYLDYLLTSALGMRRFEFEGPEALLKRKLPGDWIVRTDIAKEDLLRALGQICKEQFKMNIKFEKRRVEREAVIVRGRYTPNLIKDYGRGNAVHIYVDKLNPDPNRGGGGGSGTVAKFIDWVGSRERCWMIDETESSSVQMIWRNHDDSKEQVVNGNPAKLERLWKNLAAQTGLEFKKERRMVEVWMITQ